MPRDLIKVYGLSLTPMGHEIARFPTLKKLKRWAKTKGIEQYFVTGSYRIPYSQRSGETQWQNIHHAFSKTRAEALREMRSHKSDISAPKGKYQFRVEKTIGRWRPWGPKYLGWQVQFRINPKW